jgi:hypothetical protein
MKLLFSSFFIVLSMFACKKELKETNLTNHSHSKTAISTKQFKPKPKPLSRKFKNYWCAGKAEISSYELEQYRYGEKRQGEAVLIFVTEPFIKDKQVKADRNNSSKIPVLKLNSTKKFVTGIYPYSIMESVFYPLDNESHALKVSASTQEWCGQTYAQLNNREQFEIRSHSYFENEADENYKTKKAVLENELWTQIRINPSSLPVGTFKCVPSLAFSRLFHEPLQPTSAVAILKKNSYTLTYPELNRELSIRFEPEFPHEILSWKDKYRGKTSTATLKKTIRSAYWSKQRNRDQVLRDTLQLN